MDNDPYPWFTTPCLKAFAPLVSQYGFSGPVVEQMAQERYVRFTRAEKMISIVYEPGNPPFVDLFYPSPSIKDRRIPSLHVPRPPQLDEFNDRYSKLCRAQKYKDADAMMKEADVLDPYMLQYMAGQFELLIKTESEFLARG